MHAAMLQRILNDNPKAQCVILRSLRPDARVYFSLPHGVLPVVPSCCVSGTANHLAQVPLGNLPDCPRWWISELVVNVYQGRPADSQDQRILEGSISSELTSKIA
jgi:hypothetical protein